MYILRRAFEIRDGNDNDIAVNERVMLSNSRPSKQKQKQKNIIIKECTYISHALLSFGFHKTLYKLIRV